MPTIRGLLRRGLNRPAKIPRYVFGALHPSSKWGAAWRKRDGMVLFEPGGYAAGPRNRPEFAANLYHEVAGLRSFLETHLDPEERPVDRSLEVGCGYGRLTPWIAEAARTHVAIDPDAAALGTAGRQYPWVDAAVARAEQLPVASGTFDLVVTWTVLQHVDDRRIRLAAAELRRVLAPGGLLVPCERVRGPGADDLRPRPVERYRELFDPLAFAGSRERPVEPTWPEAMDTDRPPERLLAFRKPPAADAHG